MRQPANGSSWEKIVKNILISCGIGLAVSVVLLFLVSALLRFINIPHALIDPAATAALCIGALAAGLACAKLNREKGKTVVLITHSTELAEETERIITLRDGRIIGERAGGGHV